MMSEATKPSPSVEDKPVQKNRWTLIAIMVISILPISAAYFMFFTGIGVPQHTVNNGVLLTSAVNVKDLFEADDHQIVRAVHDEKKWRLLIPVTEQCDKACEDILYTTRQVHIRLGEKSERLERIAVNLAGLPGQQFIDGLVKDHPLLKSASVTRAQWDRWLSQASATLDLNQQPYYLLVDQEGFAMMSYTTQHGNLLLEDLKRALKYSIDYQ
ncbi:hypothetical protein TDB9533_03252 [Thalassocella blandensis]|nr:hypothetical protein TDB9533_03252 [Thalassocella blandensis]